MQLGMVGLGRMGNGMTKRLEKNGHEVKTYDPKVPSTAKTLGALCKQLDAPRHVWLMIPAGEITEKAFQQLLRLLEPGDTIVDGGNSNFRDSQRRYKEARRQKISFVDVGVSGGVWGLQVGFCLMAGGDKSAVKPLEPILMSLAPDDGYAHVGPSGAGHFVKMVHNGIEYGLMQAYAEGFEVMKARSSASTCTRSRASGATARSSARGCSSCSTQRSSRRGATSRRSAATSRTPARGGGRSTRRSPRTCRFR